MLKLKNIWHKYSENENWILKDINYSFEEKKYVLTGPSGIGKSTLLHIAGNILTPYKGKTNLKKEEIGFVFQFHHLLADLNIKENIEIVSKIRNHKPDYEHILKVTGIENLLSKFPNEISGGERQRVSIARALSSKPKFILADEPTGNLDPENAKKIMELFLKFNKEFGIGFCVSTHDLNWLKICNVSLEIKNNNIFENKN